VRIIPGSLYRLCLEEGMLTGVRRVARKSVPSRGTSTGSRIDVVKSETTYLLRNPANARRLLDGIKEVEAEIRRRRLRKEA
jgi:hypothetical protein